MEPEVLYLESHLLLSRKVRDTITLQDGSFVFKAVVLEKTAKYGGDLQTILLQSLNYTSTYLFYNETRIGNERHSRGYIFSRKATDGFWFDGEKWIKKDDAFDIQ